MGCIRTASPNGRSNVDDEICPQITHSNCRSVTTASFSSPSVLSISVSRKIIECNKLPRKIALMIQHGELELDQYIVLASCTFMFTNSKLDRR